MRDILVCFLECLDDLLQPSCDADSIAADRETGADKSNNAYWIHNSRLLPVSCDSFAFVRELPLLYSQELTSTRLDHQGSEPGDSIEIPRECGAGISSNVQPRSERVGSRI